VGTGNKRETWTANQHRTANKGRLNREQTKEGNEQGRWERLIN